MTDKIIMMIASFACGILFFFIGVYAQKTEKPISFWTFSEVSVWEITDVVGYNKENAAMWKLYSLWYFASGVAAIWDVLISAAILVLACTIGLFLLIRSYNKIYKKYSVR